MNNWVVNGIKPLQESGYSLHTIKVILSMEAETVEG